MITRLELKNFKSHRHTVMDLGRLTALVGPNGAGKTSVLEAIELTSGPATTKLEAGPKPAFERFARQGSKSFSIKLYDSEGTANESNEWVGKKNERDWIFNGPHLTQPTEALRLNLDGKRLAEPTHSKSRHPSLRSDGKYLPTILATIQSTDRERFDQILDLSKKVVPTLVGIHIHQEAVPSVEHNVQQEGLNETLVLDIAGARCLPAQEVSEGTLLVLGLVTALMTPHRPNLILLDRIERLLHPGTQHRLIQVIREIQELPGHENLQIIFTTHSPYIIDEMRLAEVQILALQEHGATACRPLSDHPEAEDALKFLTTGELWDLQGEDWVLETNFKSVAS